MNDKCLGKTADEGDSSWYNLKCAKTPSPVRTKRKRTNAEIEKLDNPGTVAETLDARVDLKPRWRRVMVPDINPGSSDVATNRNLFRADGSCHPAEIILKNSPSIIDEASSESQSRQTPKTPTFRPPATHPHKEELQGESPACVSGSESYDNLYLCHRSLAWSDDDWSDDEYNDHEAKDSAVLKLKGEVLHHQHLFDNSVFDTHQSQYNYPLQPPQNLNMNGQPLAVPWHQYPDSPQNTSEIFWEEKVLDILDLERMANKLSI